jgi:hypothetical protein
MASFWLKLSADRSGVMIRKDLQVQLVLGSLPKSWPYG